MRVVLDTNIVVSRYLAPHGVVADVLRLWEQGQFDLIVSPAVLDEYERMLREPSIWVIHRMSDDEIARVMAGFRAFSIQVAPTAGLALACDDPDDDKFLECAVAGNASCTVSGDRHLLALGSYQRIQILPPTAFLRLLNPPEPVESG